MPIKPTTFEHLATTVGTDYTDLLPHPLELGGRSLQAGLAIENDGDVALSDFRILLQNHPNAQWETWLSGADFEDVEKWAIWTFAGDLNTLAASGHAHVCFEVPPAWAMKVQAKVASGTTTVDLRGFKADEA